MISNIIVIRVRSQEEVVYARAAVIAVKCWFFCLEFWQIQQIICDKVSESTISSGGFSST